MSICSDHAMINHHETGVLVRISDTLHVWRERRQARRELARFTERDLHDVGLSWGDALYETEKPFWRA